MSADPRFTLSSPFFIFIRQQATEAREFVRARARAIVFPAKWQATTNNSPRVIQWHIFDYRPVKRNLGGGWVLGDCLSEMRVCLPALKNIYTI